MPEVTDLMRVAQYVKSDKAAPSEVYNAACRLLDEPSTQAEQELGRDAQTNLINEREDAIRRAVAAENERDALKATDERIRAVAARPRSSMGRINNYVSVSDLWVALDGAESHGGRQTPQTLGTGEGQAGTEAQEAAQ